MIKINLLGVARPAVPRMGAVPPSAVRQLAIFVISLVLALGIVGFIYQYWSKQIAYLEEQKKKELAEQARLAAIQAENQRYLARRKELETRINTIQMLQNSRVGPVELMTALGNTVNLTRDVFLLSATPQGGRVVLRGQANSVESIATLVAGMKGSGVFDDVQLRQYWQDDQRYGISYKFNLDCVYKPPVAATAGAGTAAPAKSPARAAM